MIRSIRTIAAIGTLLFAMLFALLLVSPKTYERTALGFAKSEVTRAMQEQFANSTTTQGLQKLSDRLGVKREGLIDLASGDLPQIVGTVIANHCRCTPATPTEIQAATDAVRTGMMDSAKRLDVTQGRVAEMIKGKYDSTITGLRRDLLIFLGTNLSAFMLIGAASFAQTTRRTLIIYPALLLSLTVAICSGFYLFNTDWFYTLLFQNFIGFGYSIWIGILFALLLDIVLNYARVTLQILSNLPAAMIPTC